MIFAKMTVTDNSDTIKKEVQEAIETAMEQIGISAETYAKMNCPVDTGRLRASISHDSDENTVIVGTNVEYAKYVELGTSKMKPRPYLKPAMQNHVNEYKQIIANELWRRLH